MNSKVEVSIEKNEKKCDWRLPIYLASEDGKDVREVVQLSHNGNYALVWHGYVQAGTEKSTIEDILKEHDYLKLVDVSIKAKFR